jgi:hypothetical protein
MVFDASQEHSLLGELDSKAGGLLPFPGAFADVTCGRHVRRLSVTEGKG